MEAASGCGGTAAIGRANCAAANSRPAKVSDSSIRATKKMDDARVSVPRPDRWRFNALDIE